MKFHVTNMRGKLGGLSRIQLHLVALLAEIVRPGPHHRPAGTPAMTVRSHGLRLRRNPGVRASCP